MVWACRVPVLSVEQLVGSVGEGVEGDDAGDLDGEALLALLRRDRLGTLPPNHTHRHSTQRGEKGMRSMVQGQRHQTQEKETEEQSSGMANIAQRTKHGFHRHYRSRTRPF